MRNLFNSIQMTKPKANFFDLSHEVKLSCNMGELIPTCLIECVPGDKFNLGSQAVVRFAPMVAPPMQRFNVFFHYFFVPNRIMWQGWESWITRDPQEEALHAFPIIQAQNTPAFAVGSLSDYLGVPPPDENPWYSNPQNISAFPYAAYQMCYHEMYRDQNVIDGWYEQQHFPLEDGDNTAQDELFILRKRAWQHDYFTSALPFAQKGQSVTIPIGGFGDVALGAHEVGGGTSSVVTGIEQPGAIAVGYGIGIDDTRFPDDGQIYAKTGDLLQTTSTINDLRRAYRLQEYLEKNARGGTRYIEHILMHFGVKGSDARLQRPRYITGSKAAVTISEVLSTAQAPTDTDPIPQGNMSGHGVSVTNGRYGSFFCEEHGYIIGIMSVMPTTAYAQGFEKHWLKYIDPTQYFYASFANIGEQPILNTEIAAYLPPGDGVDERDGTFGYVPRYAEYKYMNSRLAGEFRSSLDYWTAARLFATQPQLNEQFISCTPDHRIFAVTDDTVDKLYVHVLNQVKATRLMPKFGSPTF